MYADHTWARDINILGVLANYTSTLELQDLCKLSDTVCVFYN